MRWPVFAIFVFVLLAFQEGLKGLWVIADVTPGFLLILAVYLALSAPAATAKWACLIIGLLVDLTTTYPLDGRLDGLVLIGPACLGFLMGAVVILELRGLVFRDSPVALPLMVFTAGIFVHLVIVALLTVRGLSWVLSEPIAGFSPALDLWYRFWQLVYSSAVALPLGFVLFMLDSWWGFAHPATAAVGRSAGPGGGQRSVRRIR